MATFTFMFLVNDRPVREVKQFHEPWNYAARDTRAFYVFRSF